MNNAQGCFGIPHTNPASSLIGCSYTTAGSVGTNNTTVPVLFQTKIYDTHNIMGFTSSPAVGGYPYTGVMTIPFAGIWRIWATISYAINGTGFRIITAQQSGSASTKYGFNNQAASSNAGVGCFAYGDFLCQKNDQITITTFQNAGGILGPNDGQVVLQMISGTVNGNN